MSGDWDNFDWNNWGVPANDGGDGHTSASNDHDVSSAESGYRSADGMLRRALAESGDDDTASASGGWISQGGVLRWNASDTEDPQEDLPLREEAQSPLAAEDFTPPEGAPAAPRIRAVRAWLARRRLHETDLIGELLLERRRLYPSPADDDAREREEPDAANPLSLALTEAQATADEYETLLGLLEDIRAHNGAQTALVEFHLTLTERLAILAADPAAPTDFATRALYSELTDVAVAARAAAPPPTASARAAWEGRTAAVLATRQRVERVTAPEDED
jgi:hypothetical protein